MKKVLLIVGAVLGGLVLLGIGVFALVLNLTAGMTDSADRFFAAIRSNDMARAQAELSTEFKASTDADALSRFLADSGLSDVVDTEWGKRSVNNDRGETTGTAITSGGGRVPLTVQYIEEDGAWKIYAISKPPAGLTDTGDKGQLPLPPLEQRTMLAKRSMHDFAVSLDAGNMQHFYDSLSGLWRSQTTPDDLRQTFAVFFDQQIGLLGLDAMQPVFDGDARIDDNGVLILDGHYETTPSQVRFTQKYIYEGTDWKLIGIEVNIG